MSEKVYLITKFDLIGKILYTYKYMPELEKVDEGHGRIKYIDKETKREYYKSHLWNLQLLYQNTKMSSTLKIMNFSLIMRM